MINYVRLKRKLNESKLYDSIYKDRLQELAKVKEMSDITKELSYLFGYKSRYVLSSIYHYLKDSSYSQKVLLRIVKDKLDLVYKMPNEADAYNGPELEKLYAFYDLDTYQLLLERFAKHYIDKEGKEYSTVQYCNVLLGENKEKLKYITSCLLSNISKLFELKPVKLDTYLDFLVIGNSNSMDFMIDFIDKVDMFEKMGDDNFEEVLCFIYQDQNSKLIYERLNLIPDLLSVDKYDREKLIFNTAVANKLSRLPEKVQNSIYQSPNRRDILRRFEPIFTELLLESICDTPVVHNDTLAEYFVHPKFYTKTEEQKFYILETLRKNGEELEDNPERYQQKLEYILSIDNPNLFASSCFRETLDFICQKDSLELLTAKKEAIARFNGDFQDKKQYGYYLALLQMNCEEKTDEEKIQIISNRSKYLTRNSFNDFYQEIETSSNKENFKKLLEDTTNNDCFLSICHLIESEAFVSPDIYTKLLQYASYTDSESILAPALAMVEKKEFQEKSPEKQEQLIDSSFEAVRKTLCLEGYTIEIMGAGLLKQGLEQGELVYESPDCKAKIKVKKS